MKDLTQFKVNPLYVRVVDEMLEDCKEQGKETLEENLQVWLGYIQEHGLVSGIVSSMIYYHDTIKFYEEYKTEINELLTELIDGTGLTIDKLFGDKWDSSDPLALDDSNRNLLAWFAYEEIASRLSNYLEGEE